MQPITLVLGVRVLATGIGTGDGYKKLSTLTLKVPG